jgi:hypothetical protein
MWDHRQLSCIKFLENEGLRNERWGDADGREKGKEKGGRFDRHRNKEERQEAKE